MITQFALILLGICTVSVDSFTPSKPSLIPSHTLSSSQSFTRLRAEEKETEADEETVAAGEDASPSDILSSPTFLKRKIQVLKSDIVRADEDMEVAKQSLEAGKAEWGTQFEDLQTEYKNIQQRMSTQSKQGDSKATIGVVREMLELLDNFDRAFGAVTAETDAQKGIENEYKQVYESILKTFEELGVTEVETIGKEFDYEVHQAVMQRPSEEYEEGIVCEEFAKGFVLGDQLIRAAMVSVAA